MTAGFPLSADRGGEGANPLISTSWEVLALLTGAVVIVLFVVVLLSLSRDEHCTASQRLLWLLVRRWSRWPLA